MKKLLTLLMAAGCTMAANANIYLAGDINSWSPAATEGFELTDDDGDGVYTLWLSLDEGVKLGAFKIQDTNIADNAGMLGVENTDGITLKTTYPANLVNAKATGVIRLDESIDGNRFFDIFYVAADKKLVVVSKYYNLYVRGGFNGWGAPDNAKMNYEGNGVFVYNFTANGKLTGEDSEGIKLASGDWSVEWGGSAEKQSLSFDAPLALTSTESKNFYIDATAPILTVTFNAVTSEATVFTPQLYLKGENFGSWGTDEAYKFNVCASSPYAYELAFAEPTKLSGNFKVADADWTGRYNFGFAWGNVPVLKIHNYQDNGDINFGDGAPTTEKIYFAPFNDVDASLRGLLLTSMPEEMYIMGFGEWSTDNFSKVMTPVDGVFGEYAINNVEVNDGNNSFRIYDGKADNYETCSWGCGNNDEDYTPSWNTDNSVATATFVKGPKGKMTLPAATYNITFNIFTGVVKAADVAKSSVEGITVASNAKAWADGKTIRIAGAQSSAVYTVGGALVAANANAVNVPAGLYLVRIDNKTVKVIVK